MEFQPTTTTTTPIRPWADLPSEAIILICTHLRIQQRLTTVPHVCAAWNLASRHPRCWSSLLTVEQTGNAADYYVREKSRVLYDQFFRRIARDPSERVEVLRRVVRRAEGGMVALFLSSFTSRPDEEGNHEELLELIAESCPRLKYLSIEGIYKASDKLLCRLIRNCKELEIIDFSDSPCFTPLVVKELSRSCPNFKGFRGQLTNKKATMVGIHLPKLELMAICGGTITNKGLLALLDGCRSLEFLTVVLCSKLNFEDGRLKAATVRIPEFHGRGTNPMIEMVMEMFSMYLQGE